jgi:Meiotically Up-regulated Gene 113 (MUG113) protein
MAVYVIGNGANRLVKIGTARRPRARLRSIQQTSPVSLTLLWVSADYWSYRMERALHNRFALQRRHGEWFDLGELNASEAVSRAVEELAVDITETHKPETVPYSPIERGIAVDDLLRFAGRNCFSIAPDADLELLASLCVYGERDGLTPVHPATWRSP